MSQESGAFSPDALNRARLARGWSMNRLSRESQVDYSALWRIVRGRAPNPRFDTIQRLARALGVPAEELTGRGVAPEPPEPEPTSRWLGPDAVFLERIIDGLFARFRAELAEVVANGGTQNGGSFRPLDNSHGGAKPTYAKQAYERAPVRSGSRRNEYQAVLTALAAS